MNIHNILRPLCLITLCVQLSGCAIWDWAIGSRTVNPADFAEAEASGRANCVANSLGQIVECCCVTVCSSGEDITDFREQFSEQLANRPRIGALIDFLVVPAKLCSVEAGAVFSITGAPAGAPGPVTITWDDFGSGDPTLPSRIAFRRLLDYFTSHAAGSSMRLQIKLRRCPDTTSAESRCSEDQSRLSTFSAISAGVTSVHVQGLGESKFGEPGMSQTSDATRQQEFEVEQCTPCKVPPTTRQKHQLNWNGLL
jgi:hypothetical protein